MDHRNVPNISTAYVLKRLQAGRSQWETNSTYDERKNLRFFSTIVIAFMIAIGTFIKYLVFDSGAF